MQVCCRGLAGVGVRPAGARITNVRRAGPCRFPSCDLPECALKLDIIEQFAVARGDESETEYMSISIARPKKSEWGDRGERQ
jgi:hypothetical protein